MQLPPFPFVVLDTETTGFVPKTHRIIEYAAVRTEGGEVVHEHEELFSIPDDIPPQVQALTHIYPQDLEGKPSFEEKREELQSYVPDGAVIVGQNINYDIGMLRGEGWDLTGRAQLDTAMLASLTFPELESYSLAYVSSALSLPHEPIHRALGDVHATLALLGLCWQRMLQLPEDKKRVLVDIFSRSSDGYKILAEALRNAEPIAAEREWWHMPSRTPPSQVAEDITLPIPEKGTVQIVGDSLSTSSLQSLINACLKQPDMQHIIAVKSLPVTKRITKEQEGVQFLEPPFNVLDNVQAQTLLEQETFTADEATLATKLHWFSPHVMYDIPIHAEEKNIWNGNLGSTEESNSYHAQFENMSPVVIIDHRHLLSIVSNSDHPGCSVLTAEKSHCIIGNATMLEDTTTKAFGAYVSVDILRTASQKSDQLKKFCDLLSIWIERIRNFTDLRYITLADLQTAEVESLNEQLGELLSSELSKQVKYHLKGLQRILNTEDLNSDIRYIEIRRDGAQTVVSAPDSIGSALEEHLYSKVPTTLLAPASGSAMLEEILPKTVQTTLASVWQSPSTVNLIEEERTLESIFADPPSGKTIILAPSKRSIEDVFIRYTDAFEERGITLICQSFSGGMGRMQATFQQAEGDAVWIMTPWAYEDIDLKPETIDLLVLASLPFDHPSHAVLSRRAEHYQNAFMQYSLPRALHRIFRLLQTFSRIAKKSAEVLVIDDRLRTKRYGSDVREFLHQFSQ